METGCPTLLCMHQLLRPRHFSCTGLLKEPHLQRDDGVLGVVPRVLGQRLGRPQQRLRKGLHPQLGPPLRLLQAHVIHRQGSAACLVADTGALPAAPHCTQLVQCKGSQEPLDGPCARLAALCAAGTAAAGSAGAAGGQHLPRVHPPLQSAGKERPKPNVMSFSKAEHAFLVVVRRWCAAATSKAPAPGTTAESSSVFFTARSPSRIASLICASVWSAGPCRVGARRSLSSALDKSLFRSSNTASCFDWLTVQLHQHLKWSADARICHFCRSAVTGDDHTCS